MHVLFKVFYFFAYYCVCPPLEACPCVLSFICYLSPFVRSGSEPFTLIVTYFWLLNSTQLYGIRYALGVYSCVVFVICLVCWCKDCIWWFTLDLWTSGKSCWHFTQLMLWSAPAFLNRFFKFILHNFMHNILDVSPYGLLFLSVARRAYNCIASTSRGMSRGLSFNYFVFKSFRSREPSSKLWTNFDFCISSRWYGARCFLWVDIFSSVLSVLVVCRYKECACDVLHLISELQASFLVDKSTRLMPLPWHLSLEELFFFSLSTCLLSGDVMPWLYSFNLSKWSDFQLFQTFRNKACLPWVFFL